MTDLNPEQFGMSQHEANQMHGRALGEHLWEGMENIFGPMKLNTMQHSMTELSQRFPNRPLLPDPETDEPYVSARHGDWEGRYHNGPSVELHHSKLGAQEVIHVGDSKFGYPQLHAMVKEFAENPDTAEYLRQGHYR